MTFQRNGTTKANHAQQLRFPLAPAARWLHECSGNRGGLVRLRLQRRQSAHRRPNECRCQPLGYGYDGLGQVTNGWRYWPDGSRVLGQTFDYAFDDIGNRKQTATGGDQYGGTLRPADYHPNLLNQYTNRAVPGFIEVNGTAAADSPVTVNGVEATRQGDYFRREVPVDNTNSALSEWLTSVAANASGTSVVSRLSLVPQTPESFTYDLDGNLTGDGLWSCTWDAENRRQDRHQNHRGQRSQPNGAGSTAITTPKAGAFANACTLGHRLRAPIT